MTSELVLQARGIRPDDPQIEARKEQLAKKKALGTKPATGTLLLGWLLFATPVGAVIAHSIRSNHIITDTGKVPRYDRNSRTQAAALLVASLLTNLSLLALILIDLASS